MSIRKRESKKHPGGVYEVYLYYSDDGVRRRHSESGFLTRSEAKQREIELIAEYARNGRIRKKIRVTFVRTYEEFLKRESDQYSPNTIRSTKCGCRRFLEYLRQIKKYNIDIKRIDYGILIEFFNTCKDNTKRQNESIKDALNRVFRYAMRAEYIEKNPLQLVVIRGREPIRQVNTYIPEPIFNAIIEELMSYNDFLHEAVAIACLIAYYTGCRSSEVLALKKEDIDFKTNRILLNKKVEYKDKEKDSYIVDVMKTEKSYANQLMPKPLKDVLLRWVEKNPYDLLVCRDTGELFYPTQMTRYAKRAAQRIGFDTFTFHSLRHTFVTNLVLKKVDIKTVQELARHKNISVTLGVYTHITEETKRAALDKVFSCDVESDVENRNHPKYW